MPKSTLPVIAAIPNYNMADSLAELLPQLVAQGYAAIYVLDDVSTDDSQQVVAQFGPKVTWIGGTDNLGSGGTRNRILEAHPKSCIIHFLDADVELLSDSVVLAAREMLSEPNTGFVGGLVLENGRQSLWNFGQYPTHHESVAGMLHGLLGGKQGTASIWKRSLRRLLGNYRTGRPDLANQPFRQEIFWTSEANLLIERDVFQSLGGFDPTIREHDIMTLAFNAHQKGLKLYFDPAIAVEHKQIKNRGYNRYWRRIQTARYLRRKFGFSLWI